MSRPIKPIPEFGAEAEERAFWESNDSADYVDWSKARRARFPNLLPTPPAANPAAKDAMAAD